MANVLNEEKKQQLLALGRLGWPLRQIQQATRIHRETASQYLEAAGIPVRPPGGWGRRRQNRPQPLPTRRSGRSFLGAVAMPCRIQDPDRKGKVESGICQTQKTPSSQQNILRRKASQARTG